MKKHFAATLTLTLCAMTAVACGDAFLLGEKDDALSNGDAGAEGIGTVSGDQGSENEGSSAEGSSTSDSDEDASGEGSSDDESGGGSEDSSGDPIDGPDFELEDPGTEDSTGAEETGGGDTGGEEAGSGENISMPPEVDPSEEQPAEPEPTPGTGEEVYEPCADKSCGDECEACPPGVVCVIGAGFCNADGQCLPNEPECTGGEEPAGACPGACAVPDICMLCGDGCAEAIPTCNADGSCGPIEYRCEEEPAEPRCPEACPVPLLCEPCADGTCADPVIQCNADGSCGDVTDWVCAGETPAATECGSDVDCPQIAAPCLLCDDGVSTSCTNTACVAGECRVRYTQCIESYEPCLGLLEGEYCTACHPDDRDCLETGEIKTCQAGRCGSALSL